MLRSVTVMVCVGLSVTAAGAATHSTRRAAVLSAWELAQRERQQLEAIPAGSRTKADYDRALDAFRAVYHNRPADVHAPASILAVAELLAEEGHARHDLNLLRAAAGQYRFLWTQYPEHPLRLTALLAEAQIEQNDVGEAGVGEGEATACCVQQAPRSSQAEECTGRAGGELAAAHGGKQAPDCCERACGGGEHTVPACLRRPVGLVLRCPRPPLTSAGRWAWLRPSLCRRRLQRTSPSVAAAGSSSKALPPLAGGRRPGSLALVSGIRHWSTPTLHAGGDRFGRRYE